MGGPICLSFLELWGRSVDEVFGSQWDVRYVTTVGPGDVSVGRTSIPLVNGVRPVWAFTLPAVVMTRTEGGDETNEEDPSWSTLFELRGRWPGRHQHIRAGGNAYGGRRIENSYWALQACRERENRK